MVRQNDSPSTIERMRKIIKFDDVFRQNDVNWSFGFKTLLCFAVISVKSGQYLLNSKPIDALVQRANILNVWNESNKPWVFISSPEKTQISTSNTHALSWIKNFQKLYSNVSALQKNKSKRLTVRVQGPWHRAEMSWD